MHYRGDCSGSWLYWINLERSGMPLVCPTGAGGLRHTHGWLNAVLAVSFPTLLKIRFCLFIWGMCTLIALVTRGQRNVQKLLLFFQHVGPRDGTQAGSLYQLSHQVALPAAPSPADPQTQRAGGGSMRQWH